VGDRDARAPNGSALRIRFYGRDAEGAQLGCDVLRAALRRGGRPACVSTTEGAGEPADAIVVLDPALLAEVTPASLSPDALLFVNAPAAPCGRAPQAGRVLAADASAIACGHGLGAVVATAMVGFLAGTARLVALDTLEAAIAADGAERQASHIAALTDGYRVGTSWRGPHDVRCR
jgi:Pyruvate/2-oxoacid:ferredoxin oxidoreductase gamma subunit